MTYRPPGYGLVSDEDRALYDAVTARMAAAVEQQRHDRHAAWRAMGDRNGWCHIDGRPDDLLAVRRVTKTQIVTVAHNGRERRHVLATGLPFRKTFAVFPPRLVARSLPRKTAERALSDVQNTASKGRCQMLAICGSTEAARALGCTSRSSMASSGCWL